MINIYKIHNEKFKSVYISYNFTFKIDKSSIPKNVITSLMLSKGSNKYKTSKEIEKYLSELYGTNFDVNTEKIGDLYNIEFRLECVNKTYLPNQEDVLKKAIDFLYEILYNPKIEENKFDAIIFEREKKFVIDKISKRKDEKLKYAVLKTEELLCMSEPFGVYVYGNLIDAKNVTINDIYNTYQNIIKKSFVSVIISGNLNGYKNIEKYIENTFKTNLESSISIEDEINKSIENRKYSNEIKGIKEINQTNQAVITLGMTVEDLKDEDFYALSVYNSILGGTPSSKLFQNVREKESLAYTASSRYYRFKGIFIIYAGIEESNYQKAKEVILKQIEDISNGNISKLELDTAKKHLINNLLEWKDSKVSLEKLIYSNLITCQKNSIDKMISKIDNIDLEDISLISKKIKPKLIYLLGGENDE